MASPKENTGLRFFTEEKCCWAESVSGFVTIPVYPVLYALREGLAWWSSLAPPTSANECRLSLSRCHPDLRVFSPGLQSRRGFPPSSKNQPPDDYIWQGLCSG